MNNELIVILDGLMVESNITIWGPIPISCELLIGEKPHGCIFKKSKLMTSCIHCMLTISERSKGYTSSLIQILKL